MTEPGPDHSSRQVAGSDEQARLTLLSHDIRAALSDVIGGLRLIDAAGLDPAASLQLDRVRSAGEILARLIEEAMPAMSGDGAAPAPSSNLHLERLLDDLEHRWAGRAREKGLAFEVSVEAQVPRLISTPRLELQRILANLLGNAIKYTDQGQVRLEVEIREPQSLCFTVLDDGPGFSDSALAHLFEYAGRPDGASKPGDGLGLHIAKDIADQLGGELRVRNRPEGGSQTSLCLPETAWLYTPYLESGASLPDLTSVRLLVAEDNSTNQLILAQMLDIMGAEYEIATDGVEALKWLERASFDAALIDIDMPRLSGIDVMKTIRGSGAAYCDMPIMAITAYVLHANREAIYRAGADRILAKPVLNIDAFGQAVATLFKIPQTQPGGEDPNASEPDFDPGRLERLLQISGPEGSKELLKRIVTDLGNVRQGLEEACSAGDAAPLRAQTHVLISLAGAVGANRLRAMAATLNQFAHGEDFEAARASVPEALTHLDALLDRVEDKRARFGLEESDG